MTSFRWRGRRRLNRPGLVVVPPSQPASVFVPEHTYMAIRRHALSQGVTLKAVADALLADLPLAKNRPSARAGARFGVRTRNGRGERNESASVPWNAAGVSRKGFTHEG